MKVGLEIEIGSDSPELDDLKTALRHAGLSEWTTHPDSSCGGEFVSKPMALREVGPSVVRLMEVCRAEGVTLSGGTPGVHVHLDAQHLSNLEILHVVRAWLALEGLLFFGFAPAEDRRHYCEPLRMAQNPGGSITEAVEEALAVVVQTPRRPVPREVIWYLAWGRIYPPRQKYIPERYRALNLAALALHGTLEVRIFNATLDPRRIVSYAAFVHSFTRWAIRVAREQRRQYHPWRLRFYDHPGAFVEDSIRLVPPLSVASLAEGWSELCHRLLPRRLAAVLLVPEADWRRHWTQTERTFQWGSDW